jgi:hypothetical protein
MCGRFNLDIQGRLWPELVDLYPEDLVLHPLFREWQRHGHNEEGETLRASLGGYRA